ncbi:hypothetical protein LQW54_009381 [Pestalotiopsis sp. IQ-011]
MPPIKLENADQASIAQFQNEHNATMRQYHERHQAPPITIDDDELDEENLPDVIKHEIDEEIYANFDISEDEDDIEAPQSSRLMSPEVPAEQVNHHWVAAISDLVERGDMVEFDCSPRTPYNSSFLRVTAIRKSAVGDEMIFRGVPYTRTRNTLAMLEYKRNELVEVWDTVDDDERDPEEQAKIDITEGAIVRKRVFKVTNAQWPKFACDYRRYDKDIRRTDEEGDLTCRWRMVTEYRDMHKRNEQRAISRTLLHLNADDVKSENLRVPDTQKLNAWRGTKTRGGSHNPVNDRHDAIDVLGDESNPEPIITDPGQKYTFGDVFSGAGGASCGARDAGVHVLFACDFDGPSCESYRMNFPEADVREENVSDLTVSLERKDMRFDLVHLSPPCQYWSPAHARVGKNDEQNTAILMSAGECINKLRPRIATIEQTYGILRSQHMQHFHLLLNCFTTHGYSVTWKFVRLNEWGVPQPRKRVIVIASCPGEIHPKMPGPSDERPTINELLAKIPRNATHHEPPPPFPEPKEPYDGNGILKRTMTTKAAAVENYHPSGLRVFTNRELAVLQTFPPRYMFLNRSVQAKKQIGNAFPPIAVKHLYEHLLAHLREVDLAFLPGEVEVPAQRQREGRKRRNDNDDDDDEVMIVRSIRNRSAA